MDEHGLKTTYHTYEKLTPPEYFRQGVFRKFPRIINKITIIVVPALFLLGYSVEVVSLSRDIQNDRMARL